VSVFSEYKGIMRFVLKFIAMYLLLNTSYGLWINKFDNRPDSITKIVSYHTSEILNFFDQEVNVDRSYNEPKMHLKHEGNIIISVFEGCNSVNVLIVFISFLVAYNGKMRNYIWFIPVGIIVIYLINLTRVSLLYYVAFYNPDYLYYTHKYLFTGIIYSVTFLIWYAWIKVNAK